MGVLLERRKKSSASMLCRPLYESLVPRHLFILVEKTSKYIYLLSSPHAHRTIQAFTPSSPQYSPTSPAYTPSDMGSPAQDAAYSPSSPVYSPTAAVDDDEEDMKED